MLAILSDVHANLEALQAVLTDARDHGAATCISLGDHIGFNGDPAACLDLLIPRLSAAVQGNHEAELLHPGTFGVPLYEHMMQRTAAMLSPWHMDWLAQLPLTRSYGSLHLLHAPTDGHRWKRISTPSQAAALLRSQPQPLFLTGHTHRPAVFTQRGSTIPKSPSATTQPAPASSRWKQQHATSSTPAPSGNPATAIPAPPTASSPSPTTPSSCGASPTTPKPPPPKSPAPASPPPSLKPSCTAAPPPATESTHPHIIPAQPRHIHRATQSNRGTAPGPAHCPLHNPFPAHLPVTPHAQNRGTATRGFFS